MAHVTVLKHTRDRDFRSDFMKWTHGKDIVGEFGIKASELGELFVILEKFTKEIDLVQSIRENSHFITNEGLHHVAAKLLEEFIKQDTHYVIIDNVEVFNGDHMLVVLTD